MGTSGDHDLWRVRLSEHCVVEMTIEEIDTAFNAGRIDATTPVQAPGTESWTTLGEAAGLGAERHPRSLAPLSADAAVEILAEEEASDGVIPGVPRRPLGRTLGVAVGLLIVLGGGALCAAYVARPAEFAAARARVVPSFARPASPPAPAALAPPPKPRDVIPPPPASDAASPVAAPAAVAAAAITPATRVEHLPDAKQQPSKDKTAKDPKRKKKKRAAK